MRIGPLYGGPTRTGEVQEKGQSGESRTDARGQTDDACRVDCSARGQVANAVRLALEQAFAGGAPQSAVRTDRVESLRRLVQEGGLSVQQGLIAERMVAGTA